MRKARSKHRLVSVGLLLTLLLLLVACGSKGSDGSGQAGGSSAKTATPADGASAGLGDQPCPEFSEASGSEQKAVVTALGVAAGFSPEDAAMDTRLIVGWCDRYPEETVGWVHQGLVDGNLTFKDETNSGSDSVVEEPSDSEPESTPTSDTENGDVMTGFPDGIWEDEASVAATARFVSQTLRTAYANGDSALLERLSASHHPPECSSILDYWLENLSGIDSSSPLLDESAWEKEYVGLNGFEFRETEGGREVSFNHADGSEEHWILVDGRYMEDPSYC